MQVKTYALIDQFKGSIILNVPLFKAQTQLIIDDLNDIIQTFLKTNISQFSKLYPPSYTLLYVGIWYYRPFNKQVIQLVLTSTELPTANIEMLIDTIMQKIFENTEDTPKEITQQQQSNIYDLLRYFDHNASKDPSSIAKILETLNNTKASVQQNIEKMLTNQNELKSLESKIPNDINIIQIVKSTKIESSSTQFLQASTQLKNKSRKQRLKQYILIGTISVVSIGGLIYLFYG